MRTATFLTLIVATWLGPRLCCCATSKLLEAAPPPTKLAAPEKACCCCEPPPPTEQPPADAPEKCPCCEQGEDWVAVAPDAAVSPPAIDALPAILPPDLFRPTLLPTRVEPSTQNVAGYLLDRCHRLRC